MKILFCHGLEGSPNGRKATALRDAGHEVVAPALPKEDFSPAPFPKVQVSLERVRETAGGNVNRQRRPERLYVEVRPDDSG